MSTEIDAPADDITLPALPEGIDRGFAAALRAYARAAVKLDRQRGDEKRHFICLCPDCTKPADRASTSRAAVPEGWKLVATADLQKLCDSISGDCYMGQEFEVSAIRSMLAAAPRQPAAVDVGAAQAETAQAAPASTLIDLAREVEALKRPCGMDPESPIAIQNGRYMGISYKLRALAAAAGDKQP